MYFVLVCAYAGRHVQKPHVSVHKHVTRDRPEGPWALYNQDREYSASSETFTYTLITER